MAERPEPMRPGPFRWWLAVLAHLPRLLARRLYLRIWLSVVLGVALLMALVGWAWRLSVEHNMAQLPVHEWALLDAEGQVLALTRARPGPGQPLVFELPSMSGPARQIYLERRADGHPALERHGPDGVRGRPPHPLGGPPWWARPPYGFFWLLGLMGLGAALALYPVVRRLTVRLENLQQRVQRWGEGDLSVRMPEVGDDEVADLSRRFNAAAGRIQSLLVSQKSLLANASHELRSPLARIRMGLELMDTPGGSEAMRQRTRQEILRNMAELDQLIDEILLASRLDAHEADMGTVEAVDLVGLCAEECARVGVRLDVPVGMSILDVQGVAKLLRRMVRNLLENAVRYGRAAGPATATTGTTGLAEPDQEDGVILSLRPHAGQPELWVCDRGPGVPPEYRQRIFEPFFRLPGASERAGGVGLGLSLVQSIAQRHGWTVRCEDRTGGGACFVVSLTRSPGS